MVKLFVKGEFNSITNQSMQNKACGGIRMKQNIFCDSILKQSVRRSNNFITSGKKIPTKTCVFKFEFFRTARLALF